MEAERPRKKTKKKHRQRESEGASSRSARRPPGSAAAASTSASAAAEGFATASAATADVREASTDVRETTADVREAAADVGEATADVEEATADVPVEDSAPSLAACAAVDDNVVTASEPEVAADTSCEQVQGVTKAETAAESTAESVLATLPAETMALEQVTEADTQQEEVRTGEASADVGSAIAENVLSLADAPATADVQAEPSSSAPLLVETTSTPESAHDNGAGLAMASSEEAQAAAPEPAAAEDVSQAACTLDDALSGLTVDTQTMSQREAAIRPAVVSLGEASNNVEVLTAMPERTQEAPAAAAASAAEAALFSPQLSYEMQAAAAAAASASCAPTVIMDMHSPVHSQPATSDVTLMRPLAEDELGQLYQNPLLAHNENFIRTFLGSCHQERHPLAELVGNYLRHRLALANIDNETQCLKRDYYRQRSEVWVMEDSSATQGSRCRDGRNVEYTHHFKSSHFNHDVAFELNRTMKTLREASHEKRSMEAYEAQLSWLHVEQYLYRLVDSSPMFRSVRQDGPITAWAVMSQSEDIVELRNCVSVLFGFERRPISDEIFVKHLREWTERMVALLLRVATLSDHLFILNHVMRCPAGIARWATSYLQVIPPHFVHQQASIPHPTGVTVSYSQYSQPLMDLFVTVVATLLKPIEQRNDFLSAFCVPDTPGSPTAMSHLQSWTLIDEDGEDVEDESPTQHRLLLSEADYTSLFEQLPFMDMFKYILKINPAAGESIDYQICDTCSHDMLTLLAFTTRLLRLLAGAFDTLTQARYRQFNKRVGRTMRLMVQFVADHWMAYVDYRRDVCKQGWTDMPSQERAYCMPRHTLQQLQLEFDEFFCRALLCILATQKMNRWQVISGMPYACLSPGMLWHIFWLLHSSPLLWPHQATTGHDAAAGDFSQAAHNVGINGDNWRSFLFEPGHRQQFVDGLAVVNPGEAIFLLTTFANMARGCQSDVRFVEAVVLDIFELGYLTPQLVDFLSRAGRDLFNSISAVHPFVISILLQRVQQSIEAVSSHAMVLFNTLPMEKWVPIEADIQLLQDWLLGHHPDTVQCQLARRTLAQINWCIVTTGDNERLAVPLALHHRVSVLIVEALSQWSSVADGKTVMAPSQFNFQQSLSHVQQSHLTNWAWCVILGLRLHADERPRDTAPQTPSADGAAAAAVTLEASDMCRWIRTEDVPALKTSPEFVVVQRLLSVSRLAVYVALSACDIGHNPDLFLESGMAMLAELSHSPDGARPCIRVLSNCLPMFFLEPERLIAHPLLEPLLMSLLQDRVPLAEQYMYLFWSSPSVSDTIKQMKAMVQMHIRKASEAGMEQAARVTSFWVQVLTSLPSWQDNRSILVILDGVMSVTIAFEKSRDAVRALLCDLIRSSLGSPKKQGFLSSLFSGNTPEPPSLIAQHLWASVPWLSYALVDAEEHYEIQCGLHDRMLKALRADPNTSVDAALAEAFPSSTYPSHFSFPHWRLAIYRWARLAQDVPSNHALHLVICQRFFALFLERRALCEDEHPGTPRHGQGQRFFDSISNTAMLRGMKQKLRECYRDCSDLAGSASRHERNQQQQQQQLEGGNENGDGDDADTDVNMHGRSRLATAAFYDQARRLYQTMDLWLDEPRLHTASLHLPSLPAQYEPPKIQRLIDCDRGIWLDYLDQTQLDQESEDLKHRYHSLKCTYGVVGSTPPVTQRSTRMAATSADITISDSTPCERIMTRLGRFSETIQAPPAMRSWTDPVPPVRPSTLQDSTLLLEDVKENFNTITEAARNYLERVSRHTALDMDYMEAVQQLYTNSIRQIVAPTPCTSRINPTHRCGGAAEITVTFREATVSEAVRQRIDENRNEADGLLQLGIGMLPEKLFVSVVRVEAAITELIRLKRQGDDVSSAIPLFFNMVKHVNDTIKMYPPSRQFFVSCIDVLGQAMIAPDPSQTGTLLDVMMNTPSLIPILSSLFYPNRSPVSFGPLYTAIANSLAAQCSSDVFSLLSKFDVHAWLAERRPMMSDRSRLITSVGVALQACGLEAVDELAVLGDLLRRHLQHLFLYRFPEHYSDVLHVLLNGSASGKMSLNAWYMVLGCVGCSTESTPMAALVTPPPISKQLTHSMVKETMSWFGEYFSKQKHQPVRSSDADPSSLTGPLYTNWKHYAPTLSTFMVFLSKTDVDFTCNAKERKLSGLQAEDALKACFDSTVSMFSAWIHCFKADPSSPTGQRVCCPWNPEQASLAAAVFAAFSECVLHMQRSFYMCARHGRDALCLLWEHYCTSLAHCPNTDRQAAAGTPSRNSPASLSLCSPPPPALQLYHARLLEMSWSEWVPALTHIDGMQALHNDHPRECFLFLGRFLPCLDWPAITESYRESNSPDVSPSNNTSSQLLAKFLRLLATLCTDPTVTQDRDSGFLPLLERAVDLDWSTLGMSGFQHALQWVEDVGNPASVLNPESSLTYILRVLYGAAEFKVPNGAGRTGGTHEDAPLKRLAYIEYKCKQVERCSEQPQIGIQLYKPAVTHLLGNVETAAALALDAKGAQLFVTPLFQLLNSCASRRDVVDILLNTLLTLMTSYGGTPFSATFPTPRPILSILYLVCACQTLQSPRHMVLVVEACITTHFSHLQLMSSEDDQTAAGWVKVLESLSIANNIEKKFIDTCVGEGAVLCLYANMLQRLPLCTSLLQELTFANNILSWCSLIQIKAGEEAKIVLLWSKMMELLCRQLGYGTPAGSVTPIIRSLLPVIFRASEDKASDGLLGAIGLGKRSLLSVEFRLFGRALAAFVASQVVSESTLRVQPNASGHPRIAIVQPGTSQATLPKTAVAQLAQRYIASLESLKTKQDYNLLGMPLNISIAYALDPQRSFMDVSNLISVLSSTLFPNDMYLKILCLQAPQQQ
ncbi:ectopic P granules protein 5 homolog [Sycon ciliatum]|uniref:ectopic P granules protein 5 homolog n=1 Tax=Sycon ciliatum TaxID=27933 RepID=UPI0031F6F6C2